VNEPARSPQTPSGRRWVPWAALAALLFAFAAAPVRSAEVQIDSPSFTYDSARKVYRYDSARVHVGALVLEADEIEINVDAARVTAQGRVRFQTRNLIGSAERAEVDTTTGHATLRRAEVFDSHTGYFLRGEEIVYLDEFNYRATDCSFTNCRPGDSSWSITAGSLDYRVDDHASGTNSILWLGQTPVLWTPYFAWPTVEKRRSGFLAPSVSTHTSSKSRFDTGVSFEWPYFAALGYDHDLTLTPRYFSQRGNSLEVAYNYAFVEGQRGELRTWGISETQHRSLDRENRIPGAEPSEDDRLPERYWVRFGHNQAFDLQTQAIASFTRTSDGQVLREYENVLNYRPAEEYQAALTHQEAWGHTALTASHVSEYTSESLFADSESFTDGAIRPQILPRLSYNAGAQPWDDLPLGLELGASVTRFVTEEGVSGRADQASPALSLPLRLFGSAELRPTFQRNFVRYGSLDVSSEVLGQPSEERPSWLADAESLGAEESFGQNDAEVEFRIPFARAYWPEKGPWQAVKHRVTPRLIYRELEDVPQPLAGLLVQPEPALKLLTFRLDNDVLGLPHEATSDAGQSIGYVNLVQRYNLLLQDESFVPEGPALPSPGETEAGEPLLPFILEAGVTAGGLGVTSFLRYHHQLSRLVEYRVGLTGSASARARYGISYSENQQAYRTPENRLYGEGNSLGLNGWLAGTDRLSFDGTASIDLRSRDVPLDRRVTRGEAAVDFHPNCYGLRLSYVEEVLVTREFDSGTGQEEDVFYVDRRILLTFNLGGVIASSRGFVLPTQ
jgi:hypothetical protein